MVSLVTSRNVKECNLDRILNRKASSKQTQPAAANMKRESKLTRIFGITEEFSTSDKILSIVLVLWNLGWFAFFVVVSIANLFHPFSNVWWAQFWHMYIWMFMAISIPATIWFSIGGVIDIKDLFKTLGSAVRDDTDDGRVVHVPEEVDAEPEMVLSQAQKAGLKDEKA